MSAEQDIAQCKELSIKRQRCIREEGHQELHVSGAGTEWTIITKDTPELAATPEQQPQAKCNCGRILIKNKWGSHCPRCGLAAWGCTCEGGAADASAVVPEQPEPKGLGVPVADHLIRLIHERTAKGVATYGEPLTTHNGRDATIDALQESVDLNQYLMQIIMEQEDEIKPLADYLLSIGGPDRDESACEMAVRLLKERHQAAPDVRCNHICPNHERTHAVYCNKLKHFDDASPHMCEDGHTWPIPINADPSA